MHALRIVKRPPSELPLGFDFDNVAGNRNALTAKFSKKYYGVEPHLLSATEKAEVRRLIRQLDEGKLKPVRGTLQEIPKLAARGHKIYFITANEGRDLEKIRNWCIFHQLPVEVVGVGYNGPKLEAALDKRIVVFADDKIENLAPLVGHVPNLFLFRGKHNKHVDPGTIARSVSSWGALGNAIRRIG